MAGGNMAGGGPGPGRVQGRGGSDSSPSGHVTVASTMKVAVRSLSAQASAAMETVKGR